MPQVERKREINRRRHRHDKVRALRARLVDERDTKVRARLISKIKKVAPAALVPEK